MSSFKKLGEAAVVHSFMDTKFQLCAGIKVTPELICACAFRHDEDDDETYDVFHAHVDHHHNNKVVYLRLQNCADHLRANAKMLVALATAAENLLARMKEQDLSVVGLYEDSGRATTGTNDSN